MRDFLRGSEAHRARVPRETNRNLLHNPIYPALGSYLASLPLYSICWHCQKGSLFPGWRIVFLPFFDGRMPKNLQTCFKTTSKIQISIIGLDSQYNETVNLWKSTIHTLGIVSFESNHWTALFYFLKRDLPSEIKRWLNSSACSNSTEPATLHHLMLPLLPQQLRHQLSWISLPFKAIMCYWRWDMHAWHLEVLQGSVFFLPNIKLITED